MVRLVTEVTWEAANGERFASFEDANKVEAKARLIQLMTEAGFGFIDEIAEKLCTYDQIAKAAYDYHFASPSDVQLETATEITSRLKDVATIVRAEETPGMEGIDATTIPRLP